MIQKTSFTSIPLVAGALVLLPPLGIVLFCIRQGTSVWKKVVGSLLGAGITVFHLYFFFSLHVELDGTGKYPIFSFYDPEDHFAELEQSRARQQAGRGMLPEAVRNPLPDGRGSVTQREPLANAAIGKPPEGRKNLTWGASPRSSGPNNSKAPEGAKEIPVFRPSGASLLSALSTQGSRPGLPSSARSGASGTATAPARAVGYWTDFRGAGRNGRYDETKIRTNWPPSGLPQLWKQPIGGGYASFVIAEGRAFTIEQRRDQEVVTAYDVDTGKELWAYAWAGEFRESMGGDGPRATPTWDHGYLYALGAMGHLACLEAATGKLIWEVNILEDNGAANLTWGMACSPLIVEEKMIVLPGGRSGNSVVAYHKMTGKKIWSSLNDKQSYTSPMLATLAAKRQLLVVSARRAMGLRIEDGALLWEYPWMTSSDINCAQPIVSGPNRFFISAGYGHGAAVVEVTGSDAAGYRARTIWENINMKNKFNSSVLHEDHIYGLDEGILACVNASSGERKWKGGRYGYGQLLLADGHLIVLTEKGELVLVRATPERHEELSRFSALSGKTWNVPAIAAGRLLVRNATEMACFDLSPR